jgi:hypothetical protein
MQNACLGIRKNKFENGVTFEKVKENRAKSKRYSRHGTASSSSSSTGSSVILFVKIVSVWPILLRI